jgi:hypothetical protein
MILFNGQVSDYAGNAQVLGLLQNTYDEAGGGTSAAGYNTGGPAKWNPFKRKLSDFKDGTSNTILIGEKSIPVEVYEDRGPGDYIGEDGLSHRTCDDPITLPGPYWHHANFRIITPDVVWYISVRPDEPAGNPCIMANTCIPYKDFWPGEKHFLNNNTWNVWFPPTTEPRQDDRSIACDYCFGSPYPGGTPVGMADGSVRILKYNVNWSVQGPLLTPFGEDVNPDILGQ